MKKPPKNVDAYIESAPREHKSKLIELRKIIKAVAPKAEESISYNIPFYEYKGRLVYFLLAKKHIGLYIPTPIIENHKEELKNYKTEKATVQLSLEKKLPVALIKKLVKARLKMNEAGLGKFAPRK